MVLRLVLVGAVAGLGLNLPSRRDLETWGHSAQRWVNARLAEWDTRGALDESAFVYIAETEEQVPSTSAQHDGSDRGFAEVVDAMAASFAQELAAVETAQPVVVAGDTVKTPVIEPSEGLAIAPPAVAAPVEADEVVAHDRVFEVVLDEVVSSFAADLAAVHAVPPTDAPDRAFEAVVDGMVATFSAELVAMNQERERSLAVAAPVVPVDDNDDLYTGEAYALNRANDGLGQNTPKANEAVVDSGSKTSGEPVIQVNQLGNAVRLTREAVFAWASLLHGPAVVTLSR